VGWKRSGKNKFIDSEESKRGKINERKIQSLPTGRQGAQQDFEFPKLKG
jgi:hypothetical protein